MKGREMLNQLKEVLGTDKLLEDIIQGMSQQEAQDMAEHIDRMWDTNLFDMQEENEV